MSFPAPQKLAQNAGNAVPGFKLDGLLMEPKYDGFRLLVEVTDNGTCAYTRTGNSQKGKLPLIEQGLAVLPAGTWIDGELVAFTDFTDDGSNDWGAVQSVMGSNVPEAARKSHILTFMAFDLLAFDGVDVRPLSLTERRAALETVIGMVDQPNRIRVTPQFAASYDAHEVLVGQGWEGSIVKDPSKPYASGKRGAGWTKLKASDEVDAIIMGLESGRDLGAFVFGQYKDGVLTQRGKCKVYASCAHLKQGEVISVAHMGIMPSGSLRHAMFKRHRIDKPASECVWS